jgi:phage terminase large subunit-like protein
VELTLEAIEAAEKWQRSNKLYSYYPPTGELRLERYPKHKGFFDAGASKMARLACSANRVGKTSGLLAYEVTLHCLGEYPSWWQGRRFTHPVNCWLVGKTAETTRDILQVEMLGSLERASGSAEKVGIGTGMIPADRIVAHSPKAGVPGAVDQVWIRGKYGTSSIGFKSYGKDRDSFEGTQRDIVACDEEPGKDVFDECMMRLMSTVPGKPSGMMIVTFTPLEGYTEVVKFFLESNDPDVYSVQIGWKDAPHLSDEVIASLSRKYLPSQLKARSEGVPAIGEGAIYPIDIDEISVDPFVIPDTYLRAYGMDVGKTAVIWGALDPQSDVLYLVDEYYSEIYNPILHASAIKARGGWQPGAIDPASLQSNQMDGQKLFDVYKGLGLNLHWERLGVETGLQEVWMRLSTGRLKVFRTLSNFRQQFQRYHRIKRETVFGVQDKLSRRTTICAIRALLPKRWSLRPMGRCRS